MRLATPRASINAFVEQHLFSFCSPSTSSFQKCKKIPVGSYPWSFNNFAATELSTPPDIAITTLFFGLFFDIQDIILKKHKIANKNRIL